MATVRKATSAANVVFALSGVTVTGVVVQAFENDLSSEISEAADNTGEIVAVAFFNQKNEVSVDGLFNSASPLAHVPGDALTINGIAGHLKRINQSSESQGWQKVRMEIVKYVATFT